MRPLPSLSRPLAGSLGLALALAMTGCGPRPGTIPAPAPAGSQVRAPLEVGPVRTLLPEGPAVPPAAPVLGAPEAEESGLPEWDAIPLDPWAQGIDPRVRRLAELRAAKAELDAARDATFAANQDWNAALEADRSLEFDPNAPGLLRLQEALRLGASAHQRYVALQMAFP